MKYFRKSVTQLEIKIIIIIIIFMKSILSFIYLCIFFGRDNYLGDAYIFNETVQYPNEIRFSNIEPEAGFFVSEFVTGSYDIRWGLFSAP